LGLIEEPLFSRQHHVRITDDGYLTIYDNGVENEAGVDQDLVVMEKNYSTGEVYFTFSFNSGENLYRFYKFE